MVVAAYAQAQLRASYPTPRCMELLINFDKMTQRCMEYSHISKRGRAAQGCELVYRASGESDLMCLCSMYKRELRALQDPRRTPTVSRPGA